MEDFVMLSNTDTVLQQLLPLTEAERYFKKLYEIRKSDACDDVYKPLTYQEYARLLSAMEDSAAFDISLFREQELSETVFFQNISDLAIIPHTRYLPPVFHTHGFFEIVCVLDGKFTHYVNNQTQNLKRGDIFIMSPETPHTLCAYDDGNILVNLLLRKSTFESAFLNILPDNDMLRNFFVKTLYHTPDTPYLLFETREDEMLRQIIVSLLKEYQEQKRYQKTMLTSLLSVFLTTLLRNHEKDVIIPGANSLINNSDTVFILRYMQTNYATITLSELAEFFNYSERQLQRLISQTTGKNFSENIKSLRMAEAARLLSESSLTIAEISDRLGYYDSSSFRKHFKGYYQVTPQSYREQTKTTSTTALKML
jgi:AraC-like DNA-binding protein/mannose-6-phosphate isomerase-like protein (cupin superfamily)